MTEDDIRNLLREMRNEPIPPDSLARVRLAVDRRKQRRWLPWTAAAFAAVVAALVLVAVLPRPVYPPVPRMPAIGKDLTLHQAPVKPVQARHIVPKKAPKKPKSASTGDGVVVRIETADPDVVILLIGD